VRAVLLDRTPEAQALAGRLAELRPQLRIPLKTWLGEQDRQVAKFQAVLLMLRTPGLQPIIRENFGRTTALEAIDDFRAVLWAKAHPDDSRVPEALHLAVRTTRYTNGAHTTTFPKQAFVLLHTRYPKSPWTAATPYWY
jgi:hypothetical protein